MAESISDLFAEEMAADDSVEIEPVDESIDNPDDGADDDENVFQDDEIDSEDADTESDDDDDIEDDIDDDDEPVAEEDDFNWNEILDKYGDRTVTVTVQGEPVEVKISDLPNGFMMREDYSRKTAEIANVRKAATWAQDVQQAFENDPFGTLQAFAQAYNVNLAAQQQQTMEQDDPYEDLDPDVAAVLRKMDEQEQRHEQELAQVRQTVAQFQNQQIMEEVKSEVAELRQEFGDDLDTAEMLRLAATYEMPLREAAEHVVGRQFYSKSKEQLALEAEAREASNKRTQNGRQKQKRRASGTATKKFDASEVSVEDFNTIGELFEIEMNSAS